MADCDILWAVKNGDMETVRKSMPKVKDINSHVTHGRTLLHYAADYGHTDVCRYLIENGASLDTSDNSGVTPVLAAIFEGHNDCVKLLLERGAKIGKTSDGKPYVDVAESQEMKDLLHKYAKSSS